MRLLSNFSIEELCQNSEQTGSLCMAMPASGCQLSLTAYTRPDLLLFSGPHPESLSPSSCRTFERGSGDKATQLDEGGIRRERGRERERERERSPREAFCFQLHHGYGSLVLRQCRQNLNQLWLIVLRIISVCGSDSHPHISPQTLMMTHLCDTVTFPTLFNFRFVYQVLPDESRYSQRESVDYQL